MKKIETAEILCVGTELLLGDIVNTNAAFLSAKLAELGIAVYHHTVVGDNPARLREALDTAANRADLIVMSGGLGPTCDDLTKETTAQFFGRRLVMNESELEKISGYFREMGRPMTENNAKQARIPEGATVIVNNYGTAPGVAIEGEKCVAVMLPGPPRELEPMFCEEVIPYLQKNGGLCEGVIFSRNVHIIGMGESSVENELRCLMNGSLNPTVAPYCVAGEVRLRVTARAENKETALCMCNEMIEKIKETTVGDFIYGIDCESVEHALADILRARGLTFACAESCTGGLIAKRMTDLPGVSEVFLGGAVTYANSAKEGVLGVKHETLEAFGAVSEQVACEMAEGARRVYGADVAVSTTGIAGPGGGTAEKPVGTVCVGISTARETCALTLHLSPRRDRAYIRTVSATNALNEALKRVKLMQ